MSSLELKNSLVPLWSLRHATLHLARNSITLTPVTADVTLLLAGGDGDAAWSEQLFHTPADSAWFFSYSPPPSPSGTLTITSGHAQYQSVPVYEMKFPDLCVYWVAHEDLSRKHKN